MSVGKQITLSFFQKCFTVQTKKLCCTLKCEKNHHKNPGWKVEFVVEPEEWKDCVVFYCALDLKVLPVNDLASFLKNSIYSQKQFNIIG